MSSPQFNWRLRFQRPPKTRFTPMSEFFVSSLCTLLIIQAMVGLYLFAGGASPTRVQVSLAFLSSAIAYVLCTMIAIFTILLREGSPVNPLHTHPMSAKYVIDGSWVGRTEEVCGPDHALPGDMTAISLPGVPGIIEAQIKPSPLDDTPKGRISVPAVVTVFMFSAGVLCVTPACVMSLAGQRELYIAFQALSMSLTVCGALNYLWYSWANKIGGQCWRVACGFALASSVAISAVSLYVSIQCS